MEREKIKMMDAAEFYEQTGYPENRDKFDMELKRFDYYDMIDFAERYAEEREKQLRKESNEIILKENGMELRTKIRNVIAESVYAKPGNGFCGYDAAADRVMQLIERRDRELIEHLESMANRSDARFQIYNAAGIREVIELLKK